MERGLRKERSGRSVPNPLRKFLERFAALPLYSLAVRTYSLLPSTDIVQRLGAANDAAQSSEPGSTLAAITAKRHRFG